MKFYKNFIVLWAIFYLSVAFIGRFTTYHKEVFPFFRWSLYSKTPNQVVFPFVMVNKIGDSLIKPTNILDLNSIHNVSVIDMNLNVANFYNAVLNNLDKEEVEATKFLDVLPVGSNFELYVKEFDLSKKDYLNTEKVKRICIIQNNKIISLD